MFDYLLNFTLEIPNLSNVKFKYINEYSYEKPSLSLSLKFKEGGIKELRQLESELLKVKYADFTDEERILYLLEYFVLALYKSYGETTESDKQHILSETYLKNFWFTGYKNKTLFPKLLLKANEDRIEIVNATEEFRGTAPSYEYFLERLLSKFESSFSNVFFGGNKNNSSPYKVDLRKLEYAYNAYEEKNLGDFISNNTSNRIKLLPKIQVSLMIASLVARIQSNNYLVDDKGTNITQNTMEVISKILPLALEILNKEWTWIIIPDKMIFPFSQHSIIRFEHNVDSAINKKIMFPISPRVLLVAHEKNKLFTVKSEDMDIEKIASDTGHFLYYPRSTNHPGTINLASYIINDYLEILKSSYLESGIPFYYNIHMKDPFNMRGVDNFDGTKTKSWLNQNFTGYEILYVDEKYFAENMVTKFINEL